MMPPSLLRLLLRLVGVLIAVAGVADPVVSIERVPPQRLTIVSAVAGGGSDVRRAAVAALGPGVEIADRRPRGAKLPCVPDRPCVVIADGSIDLEMPEAPHEGASYDGASTSLLKVLPAGGPNIEITSAIAAARQHSAAAGVIRIDLAGSSVTGRKTELRVVDGAAVVGSASHEWKSDGAGSLDLRWWPIADGARVLTVEVVPQHDEVTAIDNTIQVGVTVDTVRVPVLVYEPRPSWSSTFVRRALEDDPRFLVESRARLGPTLAAGTPAARLDSTALQSAAVVVVGAPDALGSAEVELLDRYVRVRGGTLILLPGRAPSGATSRLFPGQWAEHLVSRPEPVGSLRATEILRRPTMDPADTILAFSSGLPAITVSPVGTGRIVVSGAMDAWRHRDAGDGDFDRFWRGVVAETGALGAELTVAVDRSIASPGSAMQFNVRSRRMQPLASETVRASAACDHGVPRMIRVWPQGEPGVYSGEWTVGEASTCQLDVSIIAGPSSSTIVAVVPSASRGVEGTLANLERLVAATGGISVVAGDESTLAAQVRARTPASAIRTATRPMRSPWWILPFAACLAGEWWLRRRDGLR